MAKRKLQIKFVPCEDALSTSRVYCWSVDIEDNVALREEDAAELAKRLTKTANDFLAGNTFAPKFKVSCDSCTLEKEAETKVEAKKILNQHQKEKPEHDIGIFTQGWVLTTDN